MSYVKTTWQDDVTPISSTNMNHIEDGIVAHEAISSSDTLKGHIEIATQLEVSLGSSAVLGVTPARLRGLTTASANASNNLRSSHDAYARASSTSLIKLKEFTIPISGIYRVKFSLLARTEDTGSGKIYKNGVAFGTLRSTASLTYVVFSEDLAFVAGDTCELWASGSTSWADVTNFRMYFDLIRTFSFDVTTEESPVVSY